LIHHYLSNTTSIRQTLQKSSLPHPLVAETPTTSEVWNYAQASIGRFWKQLF